MNILKNEKYQTDIMYVSELDISWERMNNKSIIITGATGMIA